MISEQELNQLYRYALALTGNDDSAYDLVHDAIVKSWRYKFFKRAPYLKKCIRNLFYDSHKRKQTGKIAIETSDLKPSNIHSDPENRTIIEAALSRLSHEERELIYLFYTEGRTYKEIAKFTKLKLGTVMSKLSRTKEKMRSFYE